MIIWIASYPKSGNTWLRAIISALETDGKFNLNAFEKIFPFPPQSVFKKLTKNTNNIQEIKKYWIKAQDLINLDGKTKFIKTHNLNCEIDGYRFTDMKNTLGAIYIVRDPRNVLISLSHFFDESLEESKKKLMKQLIYSGEKEVITPVGSWSQNYNSWKKMPNLHLVKYENLLENTYEEIEKIILFLKKINNFNKKIDINKIIETTSFDKLKSLEQNKILNLKVKEDRNFFNLGKKNIWQNHLKKEIVNDINEKYEIEMRELGYL